MATRGVVTAGNIDKVFVAAIGNKKDSPEIFQAVFII